MVLAKGVSVVIPTYYRYDRLENLLSYLQRQSLPADEIIVVDQTPLCDRPENFYSAYSDLPLKIIFLDRPSLSKSRNVGAEAATKKYLLFLDDDMECGSELLQNHLSIIEKEGVDVVYGAISTGPTLPESYDREYKQLDPLSYFLKSPNKKWDGMVLVVSGANTLIKRELFLKVGGFDVNMPRMEDIELGYRLFKEGAKMYYSSLPHAIHKAAPSGGTRKTQSNDLQYIKLFSRVYLYRKHFEGWAVQQLYLLVLKNGFCYRDLLSGVFYLSHLRSPLWPLKALLMLRKAHKQACSMLE